MEYLNVFIGAIVAAFAGGLVAGFFSIVKSIGKMRDSVDNLVVSYKSQVDGLQILAKLQRPSLAAHKATLEALRDGKCNGNVADAHEGVVQAFQDYDDYLVAKVGM